MSIEQHEQPKFESDSENMEQSNIIEGPWKPQTPESKIDIAESADQESAPEEPKDNVIIGPWPGSGLETAEAAPELEPSENPVEYITKETTETPIETEEQRTEKLEVARQKLNELPDNQEKAESKTEPKSPESEEDQKVRLPFSEQYTEYKSQICPKCKGKGRFLFLFKCPTCNGLGKISIPDRTTKWSGYAEVDKKGNLTEKKERVE